MLVVRRTTDGDVSVERARSVVGGPWSEQPVVEGAAARRIARKRLVLKLWSARPRPFQAYRYERLRDENRSSHYETEEWNDDSEPDDEQQPPVETSIRIKHGWDGVIQHDDKQDEEDCGHKVCAHRCEEDARERCLDVIIFHQSRSNYHPADKEEDAAEGGDGIAEHAHV